MKAYKNMDFGTLWEAYLIEEVLMELNILMGIAI
jgi:hypothetical protein